MQPLNAIDAIAPAFTRTHETLFKPFRLGRSWKLSACNVLAMCGSMFIPYPLFLLLWGRAGEHDAFSKMFFFAIITFYTVLMLVLVYFGGKMELVVFEMVVTRAKFVAPMWRRYRTRSWPWLGLKILVGTVATLVVCGLAYVPLKHALLGLAGLRFPVYERGTPMDPAAMQAFFQTFIGFEWAIMGLFFVLKIPSTLLNDFVLPFYVLEDMPLMTAVRRGLDVFIADPLHVILYCVMKPILYVIGLIMMEIALMVGMIPVVIAAVVVSIVLGAVLSHSGVAGFLLLLAGGAVLYAFVFWIAIGLAGYLVTLLEAYGIYFLGGRYPLLGNLLEPGPGAPYAPPPVFPSQEERKDNDGGPPMPMNPAVA